jgi:methylase of polypeptide subunit release factors
VHPVQLAATGGIGYSTFMTNTDRTTNTDRERTQQSSMGFGSLEIAYDGRVLAPRGWTELQSRWGAALAETAPPGRILELCAGAGQIGLLAIAGSVRRLVAVDLSLPACELTLENARAAGLVDRVEVRHAALASACAAGEVFPLILADPPWVPTALTGRFPEDPVTAIDGGADGLDVARGCIDVIASHLHPDGAALLQLGSVAQVRLLQAELPSILQITEVREEPDRGVVALVIRS